MATAARQIRLQDLPALVGTTLGRSREIVVTQERINEFAGATEDHQWIHVDEARAARGPFGTTVGHGFLTLSLFSALMVSAVEVTDATATVNYGLNKVRFPAPVPVGSVLSLTVDLVAVESVPGGAQATVRGVIAASGSAKPACVVEALVRYSGPAA